MAVVRITGCQVNAEQREDGQASLFLWTNGQGVKIGLRHLFSLSCLGFQDPGLCGLIIVIPPLLSRPSRVSLSSVAGIDLENIVYYKDDTHYFVMTAKKQSLLDKGVILHVSHGFLLDLFLCIRSCDYQDKEFYCLISFSCKVIKTNISLIFWDCVFCNPLMFFSLTL